MPSSSRSSLAQAEPLLTYPKRQYQVAQGIVVSQDHLHLCQLCFAAQFDCPFNIIEIKCALSIGGPLVAAVVISLGSSLSQERSHFAPGIILHYSQQAKALAQRPDCGSGCPAPEGTAIQPGYGQLRTTHPPHQTATSTASPGL
jgi:hypothetical protein